ncbi:hypothetical protein Plhal304r1_c027g0089531 [Plasmopara halstedii]
MLSDTNSISKSISPRASTTYDVFALQELWWSAVDISPVFRCKVRVALRDNSPG